MIASLIKIIMRSFLVWLASIFLIANFIQATSNLAHLNYTIKLKGLTRLHFSHNYLSPNSNSNSNSIQKEGEEEEETSKHDNKPSLKTWEVWTLFTLGVAFVFMVAFFLKSCAPESSEHDHDHDHDQSPIKDVEEAVERPPSELVFFVEKEEERFELEELLEGVADMRSHGFCSSLYVVHLKHKNDAVYAVKRLRRLKVSFEEFGVTMRKVGSLRHPNILPLVSYNNALHEKLLIYKFQANGSLLNLFQDYAEGKRAFPWKLRLSIAAGIARGLDFIHRNDDVIPHGIIKPSNIVLGDEYEPLISEYGYARFVNAAAGPCDLSMKGYAAPEKTVSEKGDVYSFGVILLELLTGRFVEKSGGVAELPRWVRSVVREEWTGEVFDGEVSGDAGMFAFPLLNVSLKCVSVDADERPTVAEVLDKIQELVITAAQQD